MYITIEDIKAYQNQHGCSLTEAQRVLAGKVLRMQILTAKSISDLKPALLGIMNFLDDVKG